MEKSKFITCLRNLSPKELTGFGKFLSRNCENQEATLAVFNYIKNFRPGYSDEERLQIDFASSKIFEKPWASNTADNGIKLQNTLSDLFLRLKEFLIHQKAGTGSLEAHLLWLDILLAKEQYADATKYLERIQSTIVTPMPTGDKYYFLKHVLPYLDCYKIPGKGQLEGYKALINCVSNLEAFYAFTQLKLACEIASRRKLFSPEELREVDGLATALPSFDFAPSFLAANPIINIYYQVYLLIRSEDVAHYDEVFDLLVQNAREIDQEEQLILLAYLQNYAANQLIKGGNWVFKKLHELDLLGLLHGAFTLKGLLPVSQYYNIIVVACKAGEFEWAETFIEGYTIDLKSADGVDKKFLGWGIVAFRKNEFQKALDLFDQVQSVDIDETSRLKPLMLACCYELGQVDSRLIYMSKAFSKQLSRGQDMRKDTIIAMKNFVRFFNALHRGKFNKELLINEIVSEKTFLKHWLLEKVNNHPDA
ncbi:MAG: hypothetical protein SH848_06485 [Saprospiraceae bacterium]|nr:hypothetical protein [Saprospiraceae bacterium]MDZ4703555.1 hypothetical protein [Saprospiraceae bacterium]